MISINIPIIVVSSTTSSSRTGYLSKPPSHLRLATPNSPAYAAPLFNPGFSITTITQRHIRYDHDPHQPADCQSISLAGDRRHHLYLSSLSSSTTRGTVVLLVHLTPSPASATRRHQYFHDARRAAVPSHELSLSRADLDLLFIRSFFISLPPSVLVSGVFLASGTVAGQLASAVDNASRFLILSTISF